MGRHQEDDDFDQKPSELRHACGEKWTLLAGRSPLVGHGLELLGVRELMSDYATYWHEAADDDERFTIWKNYEKDVRERVLMTLGMHSTLAATMHAVFFDPRFGILVIALVVVLLKSLTKAP